MYTVTVIHDFSLQDVFLIDTGDQLLTWVGSEASVDERRKCMQYAHVSKLADKCISPYIVSDLEMTVPQQLEYV